MEPNSEPLEPVQQLRAAVEDLPEPHEHAEGATVEGMAPSLELLDTSVRPGGVVTIVDNHAHRITFTRVTMSLNGQTVPAWRYRGNVHISETDVAIADGMGGVARFLTLRTGAASVTVLATNKNAALIVADFAPTQA